MALEEAARHGGRPFAERFVRFAHQDPAKLDEAERWFRRRGWLMVLGGRCIPGVRSLVALPAGVLRMPRGQYIVLTLIGSTIWNALLIGAGYVLGAQWERVSDAIGRTFDAAAGDRGAGRCWTGAPAVAACPAARSMTDDQPARRSRRMTSSARAEHRAVVVAPPRDRELDACRVVVERAVDRALDRHVAHRGGDEGDAEPGGDEAHERGGLGHLVRGHGL